MRSMHQVKGPIFQLALIFCLIFPGQIYTKNKRNLVKNNKTKRSKKFKAIKSLNIGVGSVLRPANLYQIDTDGNTNKADSHFFLLSSFNIKLLEQLLVAPEIGIYLPEDGRDKKISKLTYYMLTPLVYKFNRFHFRLGGGLSFTRINSDGGSQTLNNGNEIQNFPMPEISSTSSNFILSAGVEGYFTKYLSLRAESFLFNVHASETQIFHHTLSFHYHIRNLF